jgi:hypothetical protein
MPRDKRPDAEKLADEAYMDALADRAEAGDRSAAREIKFLKLRQAASQALTAPVNGGWQGGKQ